MIGKMRRWLMPSMLVLGTAVDALQFHVLRVETTLLIAGVYALVCAAAMVAMTSARCPWRAVAMVAPYVQQFTIGALLSTSLLFYWFSGTVSVSWPIVGIVALLMVSNEAFRHVFTRISVQVVVFAFAVLALMTTLAAYVFNSLSPVVFVVGAFASLVVMTAFLVVLIRMSRLYEGQMRLWLSVAAVFALMNSAYFLNVIPPIPLLLRDAGMYTSAAFEERGETWLARLWPGQRMEIREGDPLYAYTAIFAPAELTATMVHRWEFYDPDTRRWTTMSALAFGVSGGRSEGFRGYSYKRALREGKWRVTVETTRGQVLGRIPFVLTFIE